MGEEEEQEQAREGEEEEKEQGGGACCRRERSVSELPGGRTRAESSGVWEKEENEMQKMTKRKRK